MTAHPPSAATLPRIGKPRETPRWSPGLTTLWLVAWGVALLYTVVHAALAARLGFPTPIPAAAWRENVPLVLLWALASPLILRSAARWPVTRKLWRHRLALHWALATAFIAASNLLVRVPTHWGDLARGDPSSLGASTAAGFTAWYHLALIVYGFILGLGHLVGREEGGENSNGASLLPSPSSPLPPPSTLAVKHRDRILVLHLEDIEWVEADDDHVLLHCGSGVVRVRETLAGILARLPSPRFVRVHRSAVVQVARVREVQPFYHGDCYLILRSGARVRLSRTYRERMAAALGREI